jgi:hypothetical protein
MYPYTATRLLSIYRIHSALFHAFMPNVAHKMHNLAKQQPVLRQHISRGLKSTQEDYIIDANMPIGGKELKLSTFLRTLDIPENNELIMK